jgi:hypothetical protein
MRPLLALVHSPLVGPATWDTLAAALRAREREVVVADLTTTLAGGAPYCSRQAAAIAAAVGPRATVLVAHSGAGALMAAAGSVVEDPHGYVFIDAGLPTPGISWLQSAPTELSARLRDMAVDGWLPPWSQWWPPETLEAQLPHAGLRARFVAACPRLPLGMFEEVLPPAPSWPDQPCAYLRLSDAYRDPAGRARALGWPTVELASQHLAVLTDPELVVEPLLDLIAQLGQ